MATRNYQGSSYFNADGSRKKHKYIARKKIGTNSDGTDRFQYFYTQAELNGTSKSSAPSQAVNGVVTDAAKAAGTKIQNAAKTTLSAVDSFLGKLTAARKKTVKKIDDIVQKASDKTADVWNDVKDALFTPDVRKENKTSQNESKESTKAETTTAQKETVTTKNSKIEYTGEKDSIYDSIKSAVSKIPGIEQLTNKKLVTPTSKGSQYANLEVRTEATSALEDAQNINPYFESGSHFTTSNNCSRCTLAYELSQRGYDVSANTCQYVDQTYASDVLDFYENADGSSVDDYDQNVTIDETNRDQVASDLNDYLAEQGDGARGQFCVYWESGGGHSMAYEVTDGNVTIVDSQSGNLYTVDDILNVSKQVLTLRTDDKEISEYGVSQVHNRSENEEYYSSSNTVDPVGDYGYSSEEQLKSYFGDNTEQYEDYMKRYQDMQTRSAKSIVWQLMHPSTTSVKK